MKGNYLLDFCMGLGVNVCPQGARGNCWDIESRILNPAPYVVLTGDTT